MRCAAVLAIAVRAFPLLLVGAVLIGFANSANNLSRYVAADLVPAGVAALGLLGAAVVTVPAWILVARRGHLVGVAEPAG